MEKVQIAFVKGNEGYSLQIWDKDGSGYRYAGPKAWGNPYNQPEKVFEVDLGHSLGAKQFIFLIGEKDIKTIDDIKNWNNKHTKVSGATLYKIMCSFKEHHNCRFIICPKKNIGKKILEILGGKNE